MVFIMSKKKMEVFNFFKLLVDWVSVCYFELSFLFVYGVMGKKGMIGFNFLKIFYCSKYFYFVKDLIGKLEIW